MASSFFAIRPSQLLLLPVSLPAKNGKTRSLFSTINVLSPNFRFNNKFQRRVLESKQRLLFPISASKSSSTDNNVYIKEEKQDGIKPSDAATPAPKGPPVATILAGFLVFLLIFWVISSIVTGLIGLIFNRGSPI